MNRPRFGKPDEVDFPRAMVLYALGAFVGLAIAGYGLFTAQGTVTRAVPAEDVALVNQRPVLRSDFMAQLESETGLKFEQATRADQLRVLAEMVDEELLVQRGLELDFVETDQDTRNALVAIVRQQMVAEAVISTPTEQQLREWYDGHHDGYSTEGAITVCDLRLAAPGVPAAAGGAPRPAPSPAALARAEATAVALRAGQPLAEVLARTGLENANKCEDNLWFAAKIHLGEELFAAVRGLKAGAVAGPLPRADGLHVLQVLRNTPPAPMGFEAAHDKVLSEFKADREARITAATMRFLHQRSRISVAGDYARDYRP